MNIKQELRYIIEKHKNDKLDTFQTNISDMAKACLREIESLEEELYTVRKENKAIISNIQGLKRAVQNLEFEIKYLENQDAMGYTE